MMALLPPNSSNDRPNRWATASADHTAHAAGACSTDQWQTSVVNHGFSDLGVRTNDQSKHILGITLGGLEDVLFIHHLMGHLGHRNGTKRRDQRRLPDHGVATGRGEHRIPRPNRNGEVERGDDANGAHGMPLLIHAVLGSFGVHGQTMQLSREAHRKISDVDALDHLTNAFREDLAHFETDERLEILFVLTERVADATNNPLAWALEAFATPVGRPDNAGPKLRNRRWIRASHRQ